jgi:hypothetical protein
MSGSAVADIFGPFAELALNLSDSGTHSTKPQCENKLNRFDTLADRFSVAIVGCVIILAVLPSAVTVAPSKHL